MISVCVCVRAQVGGGVCVLKCYTFIFTFENTSQNNYKHDTGIYSLLLRHKNVFKFTFSFDLLPTSFIKCKCTKIVFILCHFFPLSVIPPFYLVTHKEDVPV